MIEPTNCSTANAIDHIKKVGYNGILLIQMNFKHAVEAGMQSEDYKHLMGYLANELFLAEEQLRNLGKDVAAPQNAVEDIMNSPTFLDELRRVDINYYKIFLIEHLSTLILLTRKQLKQKIKTKSIDVHKPASEIQNNKNIPVENKPGTNIKTTTVKPSVATGAVPKIYKPANEMQNNKDIHVENKPGTNIKTTTVKPSVATGAVPKIHKPANEMQNSKDIPVDFKAGTNINTTRAKPSVATGAVPKVTIKDVPKVSAANKSADNNYNKGGDVAHGRGHGGRGQARVINQGLVRGQGTGAFQRQGRGRAFFRGQGRGTTFWGQGRGTIFQGQGRGSSYQGQGRPYRGRGGRRLGRSRGQGGIRGNGGDIWSINAPELPESTYSYDNLF